MARAATAPSEPGKSQQYAANLIRQSLILESQEDAELTKLLTHPEEFNRQDVIATALGSFTDRTQGCHGINRLVVGLNGTGDGTGTKFTVQSLVNMMERLGIHVLPDQVKVANVAAVALLGGLLARGVISLWCVWAAVSSVVIDLEVRAAARAPGRR